MVAMIDLVLQIGNTTVIEYRADPRDHNSSLACLAFNPLLPDQTVQDNLTLSIHCQYHSQEFNNKGFNSPDLKSDPIFGSFGAFLGIFTK